MAKLATFTITGSLVGDEAQETITVQLSNNDSPGQMSLIPLSTGRNNVFFPGPPTFEFVLVIPPTGSTIAKTWDAASSTGGPINAGIPTLVSVPGGTTSINIGSAGSETIKVYFW